LSADTSVSVNCTNPTPYSVGLSAGVSPEATLSARQMIAPSSALLRYVLASGSQGLSLGRAMGSDTVSGAGNGSAQVPSSSSLIPIRQLVAPGAYSDTITITVTY
jgi:spore coat protein U-like protein